MNIVSKVIRKIKLESLRSNIKPYQNLKSNPLLKGFTFDESVYKEKFRSYYLNYISSVSSPNMAASLQLSAFLFALCEFVRPNKILDMGSGFSSFIMRFYLQHNSSADVWSVDDDVNWLKRTEEYLGAHGLSTENLTTLDDFESSSSADYDLILLDLNFVEIRKKYIKLCVERCKPGGIILFDDVHKVEFLFEVLSQIREYNFNLYTIEPVTKDEFGRYALLAIKNL